MTKPVSDLTVEHEKAVRLAEQELASIARIANLMRANSYRAVQRDILRKLVRSVLTQMRES